MSAPSILEASELRAVSAVPAAAATIVFVHLGPELPGWIGTVLQQVRAFNSGAVLLLAEAAALAQGAIPSSLGITQVSLEDLGLSDRQRVFREISPLDRNFRSGFWTFTSERFFVLECAMRRLSLRQVVHLENDVMLYCCMDRLAASLAQLYRGMAATFDNDMRCVPGILYVPDVSAIEALTDFYLYVLRRVGASPAAAALNDMQVLGALRGRGPAVIDHLPIVPADYPNPLRSAVGHVAADPSRYWQHFEALHMIFDAAALGQYLGGIDPRNAPGPSVGFVNESCIFDPRILRPRMTSDADGRRVPVVETVSGLHRVANLHIHSKNPAPFLSTP